MMYEVLIGFGLVLYLLWKYLLPKRLHQSDVIDSPINEKAVSSVAKTQHTLDDDKNRNNTLINHKKIDGQLNEIASIDSSLQNKTPILNAIETFNFCKSDELNSESAFQNQKFLKRVSPPKERLTEFLEKTILNDNKLQSIIQNLSLDKTEFETKSQSLRDGSFKTSFNNDMIKNKTNTVNDSTAQENINQLFYVISNKENEINKNYISQKEENFNVENKPLLKRLQTQPGGINFGSVIGELKSKTRKTNGGLKPVFKKFETDVLDNVQESLNSAVDDKKKVQIDENELGPNILADRRNKLETAAQPVTVHCCSPIEMFFPDRHAWQTD